MSDEQPAIQNPEISECTSDIKYNFSSSNKIILQKKHQNICVKWYKHCF